MKKSIRMLVDLTMTALLPMLMAYSLIGEAFHEIAGMAMFVLFIAHHVLNRGWFRTLFRGRYTTKRVFQTVLNLLLLVFMVVQPVSGILMSRHLFPFLHIPGVTATARELHLAPAYWGYVLLCLHAGTHLTVPLGKLRRSKRSAWFVTIGALSVFSLYGCCAFVKRQFADYLFLRLAFVFFDFDEARMFFFLDYIAVMILFAFAGYGIMLVLHTAEAHRYRKDQQN